MLHKYIFQKRAYLQLRDICDYLDRKFGVRTTNEFLSEVEHSIDVLMKFPLSGHPELISKRQGYRSKIVGKRNKMYYYLRGNTLVIAAFVDMRMSPERIRKIVTNR